MNNPVPEPSQHGWLIYLFLGAITAPGAWMIFGGGNVPVSQLDSGRPSSEAAPDTARQPQPKSGDVRTIFTADDYPAAAQMNGHEGTVRARLDVDENGLVSRCTVISSSGHSTLDNATCDILKERAIFTPGRDETGYPRPSQIVVPPIRWQLQD